MCIYIYIYIYILKTKSSNPEFLIAKNCRSIATTFTDLMFFLIYIEIDYMNKALQKNNSYRINLAFPIVQKRDLT